MISICMATYNRLPYLKNCLNSIFDGFGDYPYEIIIADGGSTDGTLEYLKGLNNGKIKLIEQNELVGPVKATNACFKKAKGGFFFGVNDDMTIAPEVVIKSCEIMKQEEKIGLVYQKVQYPGFGCLHEVTKQIGTYRVLWGKSLLFRRAALKKINYFDESYRAYHVESDTALSILSLGYTTIFHKGVGAYHYRINVNENSEAYSANIKNAANERKYFLEKWSDLQKEIENYLKHSYLKKQNEMIFKRLSGILYSAEFLRPWVKKNKYIAMKIYDWLLSQSIVFKDKKYKNREGFFLAQKFPNDLISRIR